MRTLPLSALILAVASSHAAAQLNLTRVVGRVTSPDGQQPIAGVTIRLGDLTTSSDARGLFSIQPVQGSRRLIRFERIGYLPREDSISIAEGVTTEIAVRLTERPIELPPIAVTARSRWLELNGYYERRQGGLAGKYVTIEDIRKRNPANLSDIFHGIPGLRVFRNARGLKLVRMNHDAPDVQYALDQRRRPPGCEPALFIDGTRYMDILMVREPDWTHIEDWDRPLAPLVIEMIEIYTGAATPLLYPHPCGVVPIWTRRG